ncbi:MAG TPA: TetR/AcrR family transcriptional regulator [Reyranella sp.]|nr:TetR/AcrR family transcriptional regulator [Reyranella sp.]
MSTANRQAERSAATRQALVRVARRLFAKLGYGAAATEEIVRQARVTRGALYHHFRDKQDLFLAVLDQEQQRLAAAAAAAATAESDPWQAMMAGTAAFLDGCLDPAVQQIVIVDGPAVLGPERWRELDQSYYLGSLKQLLEMAIAQGLVHRQPVDTLAHLIFGAVHEAAFVIAGAQDKGAARREVNDVLTRLFAGLRRAPANQESSGKVRAEIARKGAPS